MVDENAVRENRLNDLDGKPWVKFTKTWFVHNPPPRKKDETLHPAKYPEGLIEEFIRFFTKAGGLVFDPFLGTGSTLVAAQAAGRRGVGIELQEKYALIARKRIEQAGSAQRVLVGDAQQVAELLAKEKISDIDLVITSPPYGPMLNKKGLASKQREDKGLDTAYSADVADLGNAKTYEEFVQRLVDIFVQLKPFLKPGAHVVVIIQNYMDGPQYTTLAWDVGKQLNVHYTLRGEKLWLQDNKTLYPYGYRYAFVPNVHHHYCLIFRNDKFQSGQR